MKKLILLIVTFCIIIGMSFVLYVYLNPLQYNPKSTKTIENTIYDNSNHEIVSLRSMGHDFTVAFVRAADEESQNPGFPAIHLKCTSLIHGWMHIIKTDHADYTFFLDAASFEKYPDIYPFYTCDQDFFDAPFWTYDLLWKNMSYWIGHAYAVIIDDQTKTIQCMGGIGWGYKIPWYWPYPRMIQPTSLTLADWRNDLILLKDVLHQYQIKE